MSGSTIIETHIPHLPLRRGKVRDVYDLGDRILLVATDRISAFDWVLPTPIPGKGALLTALAAWWFDYLGVAHHLLSTDPADLGAEFTPYSDQLVGRMMLVRKTRVVPFECVVRGYLAGSGWAEYAKLGTLAGMTLPPGLRESEALPAAQFTPATKADAGHDENITVEQLRAGVGDALAGQLERKSLAIYERAAAHASSKGIVLADTKFEWGIADDGQLLLIDEVLTPDSSRYWPANTVVPGQTPPSYDKQFVRDWLKSTGWDRASPPPALPENVVRLTAEKYRDAYECITGRVWAGVAIPPA